MVSVALALAASVSWGVSDFIGGLTTRRLPLVSVLLIADAIGLGLLFPLAMAGGAPLLDFRQAAFALGGGLLGLLGIAALYRGLARGPVSIVAPVAATGAGVPVVVGFARGEQASPGQAVGILLALLGIVLVSRAAQSAADQSTAPRVTGQAGGVPFAVLGALGFGGFFVLLREASVSDVLWSAVIVRGVAVVLLAAIAILVRPPLAVGWANLPSLVAVGVLDTSANVLYAWSSTLGLITLAAVLASLFPVVTVLLARFVLRERMSAGQGTGVVCALAGVALIALK